MSYSKQTWQSGDVITAAKLNYIEAGIAALDGGGLTLYGPYTAYNSQSYNITVSQGNETTVHLDYIENSNQEECDIEGLAGPENFIIIPIGYTKVVPEVNPSVFIYPYPDSFIDDDTNETVYYASQPTVLVHNDAAYTLGDFTLGMLFMCSAEIPVKQSEE